MRPCCPCNTSGGGLRCKNCVCAKARQACSTCAPGRTSPCKCQNRPVPTTDVPSVPLSLPLSFSTVAATPPRAAPRSAPAPPSLDKGKAASDDNDVHGGQSSKPTATSTTLGSGTAEFQDPGTRVFSKTEISSAQCGTSEPVVSSWNWDLDRRTKVSFFFISNVRSNDLLRKRKCTQD